MLFPQQILIIYKTLYLAKVFSGGYAKAIADFGPNR